MKLFGGSGDRKNRNGDSTPAQAPAQQAAPKPEGNHQPISAPKPSGKKGKAPKEKKKLTPRQKGKRIAIIMAVVLVLFACAAAAAVWFVRSPQATIKDKENGDKVDVSSLLNSGTRIDDVFTFVVGAVDEDETRTDALMVATMDTKDKTINVMNIPRDTMCNNTATGASKKINAAYGMDTGGKGGNIEQTSKEIERLMGFRPDKYVIVNFDGIAAIVDAIGGVDYDVPFDMKYDDPSQNLHIDLKKGQQHLDGKQTVGFLRWRHNNDYTVQYTNGDEGRVENQQKFLKALAGQVLQIKNVTKIRSIAEAVFKNVKTDFSAGELDVLVATTIIESGIDNPHTNTLIIEDSQRYGLAQMYQLKGRVGRSCTQAYAYFMFPEHMELTEEAAARLTALNEHTDLGSGMRIAMRDLEIRGAGSLLGAEQSGNMSAVGFDLFAQMLNQAVSATREGDLKAMDALPPALSDITVNVPGHTYLPEEYVPDADERVLWYRRIASAATEQAVEDVRADLADKRPDMPQAAKNLLEKARIKAYANEHHIKTVSVTAGKLVVEPIDVPRDKMTGLRRAGGRYLADKRKLSLPLRYFKLDEGDNLLAPVAEFLEELAK